MIIKFSVPIKIGVIALSTMFFSSCSSKSQSVPVEHHVPTKIIVLEKNIEPTNIILDPLEAEEERYYKEAKTTKIWIATYKTKSNIRVRDHFVDVWVKRAEFIELEYTPPYLDARYGEYYEH